MDERSRDWLLAQRVHVADPFLRAMLWGSLWDLVREARLDPALYVDAALAALPSETDEQIASRLLGRIAQAVGTYLRTADDAVGRPARRPSTPADGTAASMPAWTYLRRPLN